MRHTSFDSTTPSKRQKEHLMLRIRSLSLTGVITLGVLSAVLTGAALGALLPAAASAYATAAPPPVFSTAPGLPDGRVYEQVSPANKNGNTAGASTDVQLGDEGDESRYSVASPDGNAVLFEGTGPMGETASPVSLFFVAQRSPTGWRTRAVMPRPQETIAEFHGVLAAKPQYILPSPDLSHALVVPQNGRFATTNAACKSNTGPPKGEFELYLAGSDPFVPAAWLNRPEVANPVEYCVPEHDSVAPVGGSPDFSTVYFAYAGTLLAEDASRVPHVAPQSEGFSKAWGFYEDREGALREAGMLPDGLLDPFGAVPAVSGHGHSRNGNEVSADGSRAFFVSPDPAAVGSCVATEEGKGDSPEQAAAACAPQLYVRENGAKTVLISRDTLLPETGALPAPAPDGALQMPSAGVNDAQGPNGSEVFASPDGSQAFFQSVDRLTSGAPKDATPKTYDFDLNTGVLTYLPGVVGQIVATDMDGSSFAFLDSSVAPAQLDLWSETGPPGGTVTPITQLPEGGAVEPVRISSDGSVVVFTATGLPSFNDTGAAEIFRYDVAANTLGCVSCAPPSVASGYSSISQLQAFEPDGGGSYSPGLVDERGISADGNRVFFETSAALVPQDTNTRPVHNNEYGRGLEYSDTDVYEWENGVVYLISSGKSAHSAYFFDNSASGDDVFFATTDGLVPGDTDAGYDVYDARVPHPGDNPPPAAVPCAGSVCQGPPNVPAPLGAPASSTFSGLGNPPPEPVVAPAAKPKATPKATKCRKGFVRQKSRCVKKQRAKRSTKGRK